ncbi:pyroglutamyl-peptidase I [Treponema phagedenis]|uniref:Pyrrolidone-carboxylate peptidase n=1 Tax=Treponema phagedenis TaxID=162 RepID=A0A0B7GRI8_TREPH|nr:pyroglutamyl-peptidase I [Treponema phagedenis]EFW38553.1 pyroglutamyl-peptidase I [Treponema phagedenis F0421]QEJ95846.1 pyroglutamyl-peptidase I [Treponema phagedenis]QSH94044.1 pyroglutamyl-peptidase I [Treponema phagedenis]QSH98529.1 pyroglutamyl-peptidase I [Treponema phagedenis]TYT78236.1 pyroglutamyl-peptidase I [Treponema phagedenis]
MKILVTGFDPFGGERINPAIESVKKLPDTILGADIIKLEIPTVIGKSLDKIKEAVKKESPDVVLSIGQAGGRSDITVERVGINIDDCRIKDNEGNQPIDTPVVKDGPAAYFVTIPIKAIVEKLRTKGIPASVSNSAGTFICNHVCYGVAHLAASSKKPMKSGFIHIPFLPEQVTDKPPLTPSMALDTIVHGITLAIEAIIENDTDIKVSGGKIC